MHDLLNCACIIAIVPVQYKCNIGTDPLSRASYPI